MRICITGNLGYIGPCVIQHLRAANPDATLVGIDTGYFAGCLLDPLHYPESVPDVQYYADVRTLPEEMFAGVDAVVHLAALSNDPLGSRFAEATGEINHLATVEVAKKARQAGVRSFVFASSCSVYGLAGTMARTEESEVNPLTAYAKSKVHAEIDLAELATDDFVVTCLRFATACGASPRLRLDLVINDFVASAVAVGQIRILSDGTPWRPLIAVRDMARAIEWAALHRTAGEGGACLVLNAGSDSWNWQVRDLAAAVAEAIPGTQISINSDAPPDSRSYRVDFGLFRSLAPGFQPQSTLMGTIAELKLVLERAKFSDTNFRQSRLVRLHVLSSLTEDGLLDVGKPGPIRYPLTATDSQSRGAALDPQEVLSVPARA
ncbi:MAG: SDR family oxidoreductase [Acidobacteria bacterium]|nr:SDR family oxidoreductase [Acidobacteriota bacterium]